MKTAATSATCRKRTNHGPNVRVTVEVDARDVTGRDFKPRQLKQSAPHRRRRDPRVWPRTKRETLPVPGCLSKPLQGLHHRALPGIDYGLASPVEDIV